MILPALQSVLGMALTGYVVYSFLTLRAARAWARTTLPIDREWTPSVTLLKPIRGVDADAYENFASFCHQDYPAERFQILFGANDPNDPALEVARQIQRDFAHLDIKVVFGEQTLQGLNRKVCNMAQMSPYAKHEILILCDSDMRVTPEYLRCVIAPLKEGVSVVTCPYHGFAPRSFASVCEALGIGADFLPSVLVSRMLEGVSYAFGSTIVFTKSLLQEIGGFEAMKDRLADDFYIGNEASRLGRSVALSRYVVQDVLGAEPFGMMWARRLRWARTLRACRPSGYAGSFITHGIALATLFLFASRFSAFGWGVWAAFLVLRLSVAWGIALLWTKDRNVLRYLPLLPISDLLSFGLFCASFAGGTIFWRGERFRVAPGGVLTPALQSEGRGESASPAP